MHDSRQHSVEQYRPSQRNFNLRPDHLHGERVQQEASIQGQGEHERERQRHCPVKNDHRCDVNVRVVEPRQRRDEKFRDLRNEDENQQNKKEDHFRPVTTKTSSRCDKSTVGVSCACPSSSRTRKGLTAPINKPGGKTPPTPEVEAFCHGFKSAFFEKKLRFKKGVNPP